MNTPMIPLPNPGEGGPVNGGSAGTPMIPLPNPGEGGPVNSGSAGTPMIPLPNPGEGGPVNGGNVGIPVIPLPNPGEGGPVTILPILPGLSRVRFLNAAFGYPSFRIQINNTQVISLLNFASVSSYLRAPIGFQTVTVTSPQGYIYIQKSMPFTANVPTTIAVINTASGLDLLQISDMCCPPTDGFSNFRVSNLAYNSGPIDVLLGDGRVIYTDVQYKETTSFKRIRPGQYQFFFAETSLTPIPSWMDIETLDSAFIGMYPVPNTLASLYLNVVNSTNYTVFLLSSGSSANAIQTMVVADQ